MRILIADDDPQSRLLLKSCLADGGYDLAFAKDGDEAWEVLKASDGPEMALVDWMMPGVEGPELCRRVRSSHGPDSGYTYLILLTGKGTRDHVVAGLDSGADDYLVKPVEQQELLVRVRAGQRIVELHSQLLRAKEELWARARTDPLTGVLNRGAVLSELEKELNRGGRGKTPISVCLLDFDHFKVVNDTFGHLAGDAVLRQAVGRIKEVIRSYDALGRFGGEEFLILLPGTGDPEAFAICERIREAIGNEVMGFENSEIRVTASVGLATGGGEDTVDHLIDRADRALYRAKGNGRNAVERAGGGSRRVG